MRPEPARPNVAQVLGRVWASPFRARSAKRWCATGSSAVCARSSGCTAPKSHPQWDIVLNPRRAALEAEFGDIEREMGKVIEKCNSR